MTWKFNISGKTYPDTTEALALAAVDEAYKSWVNSTYLKTHKYRKGLAQVLGVLKMWTLCCWMTLQD